MPDGLVVLLEDAVRFVRVALGVALGVAVAVQRPVAPVEVVLPEVSM